MLLRLMRTWRILRLWKRVQTDAASTTGNGQAKESGDTSGGFGSYQCRGTSWNCLSCAVHSGGVNNIVVVRIQILKIEFQKYSRLGLEETGNILDQNRLGSESALRQHAAFFGRPALSILVRLRMFRSDLDDACM